MNRPSTFRVLEWPVIEPVSLADAKAQVGLMPDQTEHDQMLVDKIATARRLVESRLAITLVATKYRAVWKGGFPARVQLPAPPLLYGEDYPITATVDGAAVTGFEVDADAVPGEITLAATGRGDLVVEYWGGVAPGTRVDPMLRSAILAYVDHQFNNRGVLASDSSTELPQAFDTLLAASSWNGGW